MIEKAEEKKIQGKKVDPRMFILMDDCLAQKNIWSKDPNIKELFLNGRHSRITYILTKQYALGIPPDLRSNIDYIFLLADDFVSNQKRLYEHYAGMFPSFESFKSVFADMTADYGCMVIVNRGVRKNLFNKIFYYKAKVGIDKMIGCRQFVKYSEKNYDKNWYKKSRSMDIDELARKNKKDGKRLHVKISNQD